MTDLEALQAEPTPRSDALCRPLARRIDSIWGFVAYGVLWFFVGNSLAGMVPLAAALALVKVTHRAGPLPSWQLWVLAALWAVAVASVWWLFALWVKGRVAPARRLFREGVFVSATVESVHNLTLRLSCRGRGVSGP